MRRRLIVIAAAAAVALALAAGCKSNETQTSAAPSGEGTAPAVAKPAAEPQPGGMMAQMRDQCPMSAEGAQIEVSDTENGVALTFTATNGAVADLRARTRRMAEMYTLQGGHRGMRWHHMGGDDGRGMMGEDHGSGTMGGTGMGHGPGVGMARGMMPAATATVEDVEGGARILLVPMDPSQLEPLREHARMHCERMHDGECPMLNPERE